MQVADEERQRVPGAADERRAARDHAAGERASAAGEGAVVGEAFGQAHADGRAQRGREAHEEGGMGAGEIGGGEDRRERRDRAVDEADEPRLHDLQQTLALTRRAPAANEIVPTGFHRFILTSLVK